MADLIRKGLEREHYAVMTAHTGPDRRFQLESVDLVFVARQALLQTEVLALSKGLATDLSTSSRNFHEKFRFPA